jgi:uncharacterized protein (TIGR00725 family)
VVDPVTTNGYLIAVIGDAKLNKSSKKYLLAENLGQNLIDNGYQLVTGVLDGITEAVSNGARHSFYYNEGDIIGILMKKESDPIVDTCISTCLDLTHNVIVSTADAIIAIGGGAGTVLDIANAWTLNRLIIAYRVDGVSGKIADKKVNPRIRYPDIPEDRVYGVSSAYEAIECLTQKIDTYTHRHKTTQMQETRLS